MFGLDWYLECLAIFLYDCLSVQVSAQFMSRLYFLFKEEADSLDGGQYSCIII
jgi:hypothetical protein